MNTSKVLFNKEEEKFSFTEAGMFAITLSFLSILAVFACSTVIMILL